MTTHRTRIEQQFTKQAALFQASHRAAEDAIRYALTVSGVTPDDTVLDVACGPGVLACAFARCARHVTGVDITPSMLEQAKRLQDSCGVANVSWKHCDVYRLPFPDGAFSLVLSRYALHHLEQPALVIREMARVCAPTGRVVVIDSAPPAHKALAFNDIERERDPSHTQALTPEEIVEQMTGQGLKIERHYLYAWEVTAASLLARSFPAHGDRERIHRKYAADVGPDRLGLSARYVDGVLNVTFPTLIVVGRKT